MSIKTIRNLGYTAISAIPFIGKTAFAQASTINDSIDKITPADVNTNLNEFIQSIINILLAVIGIVAVLMLIVGGLKYVFSQGDEKAVNSAKNTILYAIIGLIVAILAFAIVNFVLEGFTK